MLPYTTVQALGQARLADMHRQARRDSLARTARRARRQHSTPDATGLRAALTRWALRLVPTTRGTRLRPTAAPSYSRYFDTTSHPASSDAALPAARVCRLAARPIKPRRPKAPP